ncbi:MAG: hypothetical protein D6704_03460 [Nitrospirae bacterium]|nr:MAG: hypothetical protein D6704_03460 [Nitrospirota bacterium]
MSASVESEVKWNQEVHTFVASSLGIRYGTAMNLRFIIAYCLLILWLLGIGGCTNFHLPRFSFEEDASPRLPFVVRFLFDPGLPQATLQVDACGLSHTIRSGEIITQAFVTIGQKRLASVEVIPNAGRSLPAQAPNNVTVQLALRHQAFKRIDQGQEDQYQAQVELELLAIYFDAQGQKRAEIPLRYSRRVNMWTPELSSQSISCAAGQFDSEFEEAARQLARDMIAALPQLYGQPPAPTTTVQHSAPPVLPQPHAEPLRLSFRTLLQDANNNFVLEGGETLVLTIEVTNKGSMPISSATIELSGTPQLVQAFAQVADLPLRLPTLQPGETTTTEIRGRLPKMVKGGRGELIVSVVPTEGPPAGSHKIFAELQPAQTTASPPGDIRQAPASRPALRSAAVKSAPSQQDSADFPYLALLIGLDAYRDPWPGAYTISSGHMTALADTLRTTGLFVDQHIRILQGAHATRTDIEEALFSWAIPRMSPNTVFILYYAGQAVTHPTTGEVYLMPYEGSLSVSPKRLISLRALQRALAKAPARVTLLFLETPVLPLLQASGHIRENGKAPARWKSGLRRGSRTPHVIQIRQATERSHDPAALLAGLLGRADNNHDGTITVAELLHDLRHVAVISPSLDPKAPIGAIPLSR